ncbi:N(4)-(Beta-N-acetylglucosaminyl)-L-asparaginase-like [Lycorma delicatula]|uniref:N(4)-(Beta-N-acetylglucosaminyl)-L-asparaginase- like n=1 Tax=Lycorma delicatula TaxID=130591 RepID=UPI003F51332C
MPVVYSLLLLYFSKSMLLLSLCLIGAGFGLSSHYIMKDYNLPLIINTWGFTNATEKAWNYIYKKKKTPVETVEAGCTKCEEEQCDFTVGYGGSPDEKGETTLDAMIMDGNTMNVGAVGGLRNVKNAVGVAKHVLENTQHSILVGELATEFAKSMNFKQESLSTEKSHRIWEEWKKKHCQPNFWTNVTPDPKTSCGPYKPSDLDYNSCNEIPEDGLINENNHDTITMIAVDNNKNIAVGTSSNGANHKIPGRVGDAPIPGAGGYADATVGGAAATGDGDVMMRFLPSFLAVEEMRRGASPTEAAETAIKRIAQYYPKFFGAVIAANVSGEYGAACNGMKEFPYSVVSPKLKHVTVKKIPCFNSF